MHGQLSPRNRIGKVSLFIDPVLPKSILYNYFTKKSTFALQKKFIQIAEK